MANPFTMSFGLEPKEYISRSLQTSKVIEDFTSESPSNYLYMISGVRGAGKTVLLSNLTNHFERMKKWIVINVSPDTDILNSIAAYLYSKQSIHSLFTDAQIDLSGLGIGVSLKNATPIFDITFALEKLLVTLNKKGYKVLISIDEIVNNQNVRAFSSVFQLLLRKKLPLFLLMTGLYENINNLQNEKTLTFLYRAPKIYLEPLNSFSIAASYKSILKVNDDTAKEMSKLTSGYAYAYQVLGYLYWEKIIEEKSCTSLDDIIIDYDRTLGEYVYEKIWYELPATEKKVIALLVENGEMKTGDIKEQLGLTDSKLSVYRDRLKRKGLINTSNYGYISLILPRFAEIVKFWVD